MVTVSHLVEKIIEQKPFIQEALSNGIINNAALADQMLPEIEKELKKKVKFSAVNMAIRRLSEKLEQSFIVKAKFDKNSDITLKSNLIEITVYKMEDSQEYIKELYSLVDIKGGDFLTITQGLHELMIITNEKYEQKILEMFPNKLIKKSIKNLSSITINIPEESIETIGLFYIVTRALNWENINIVDIVSTFTEMTFIIKEEDTARSFNVLKELIKENV
jgi:aspartokinase